MSYLSHKYITLERLQDGEIHFSHPDVEPLHLPPETNFNIHLVVEHLKDAGILERFVSTSPASFGRIRVRYQPVTH